jgi:glycosyltransferase involved in cell wall biosynthesis
MGSLEETITVLSTFPRVDRIALPRTVKHVSVADASHGELVRAYLSKSQEQRCFLFNGLSQRVWVLALLKLLFPNRRRKLVVVDMVLSVPTTRRDWRVVLLRRKLMAAVDLFISYARNTKGIQEIYRIPESRFLYVPFKVNDSERIAIMETRDEGYLLVAGQTRRDFPTFLRAVEDLSIPVRIVAPAQDVLSAHGSSLRTDGWPAQVELVRDARTPDTFLPQVAGARLVVLPILEKNITPSGIGVCLVAMALRKCVIVTEGPVTEGLVDDGQAIVVPAADPSALRDEILAAWTDPDLRTGTAERGFDYATSLGGEKRLYEDLFDAVVRLCRGEAD